jgi:hypothetical protein
LSIADLIGSEGKVVGTDPVGIAIKQRAVREIEGSLLLSQQAAKYFGKLVEVGVGNERPELETARKKAVVVARN